RLEYLESQNRSLSTQLSQQQYYQASYGKATMTDGVPTAPKKPASGDWKSGWNNGLEFQSPDKDFKVHIGGRTQVDAIFLNDRDNAFAGAGGVGAEDSVNFRRARLRAEGTIWGSIDYCAEYDFVNNANTNGGLQPSTENNVNHVTAPTDLWFTFRDVPVVGNVRVGNYKEPIGFEHLTSSRFLPFMERSFIQDLFTGPFNNGFTPGIGSYNTFDEEHGTWALGFFKNTANAFAYNTGDGEYAITGRTTYLPYVDEETHSLLHFGVSGSWRDPDQERIRYRTRASLRNGPGALNPAIGDTGFYGADNQYLLGAEAVFQRDRFAVVSEWLGSWTDGSTSLGGVSVPTQSTVLVHGWHVDVMYFLTDDHLEYEAKNGVFGRMTPHDPARWKGEKRGYGAWQLLGRYAGTDLSNAGVNGGRLDDYTLGLNWFLNPNMKLQWNYVVTVVNNDIRGIDDGVITGFGMRLAHDF
ncbi:MAG: hypothetical protein KDA85_19370, partial [Planctomycetaceae bacterium]|nr:hypothetical protein [Planctomycetaceae bacterium]